MKLKDDEMADGHAKKDKKDKKKAKKKKEKDKAAKRM